MLCGNKALLLDVESHLTSFNLLGTVFYFSVSLTPGCSSSSTIELHE